MDLPPFLTRTPQVDPDAYIAPGATLTACKFNDVDAAYEKAIGTSRYTSIRSLVLCCRPILSPLSGFFPDCVHTGTADISSNSWNDDACDFIHDERRRLRRLNQGKKCPLKDEDTGKTPTLDSDECGILIGDYCGSGKRYEKDPEFWYVQHLWLVKRSNGQTVKRLNLYSCLTHSCCVASCQ